MDAKTTEMLLQELEVIVETLKASLPREAPLLISKTIDPSRALQLREACIHRVAELADSACYAFKQNNQVTAYILSRAVMETFALFWNFLDKLEQGIKTQDMNSICEMLSKILVGAKAKKAKEAGITLEPVHILSLIRHVAKTNPSFEDHYEFLCEVAHPNALGLTKAYVKNDWDKGVAYFGKEHGKLGSLLEFDLEALIVILKSFIELYNKSAELLEQVRSLQD